MLTLSFVHSASADDLAFALAGFTPEELVQFADALVVALEDENESACEAFLAALSEARSALQRPDGV